MASVLSSSTELVVINPAIAANPEVAHPVALNEALTALLPVETADGSKAEFSEPDKADQVSVRFSADGVELTHDLGGIEADTQIYAPDSTAPLANGLLDGASDVVDVIELAEDAATLGSENHSVDVNLGASESSENSIEEEQLNDNHQNIGDSQTTETNARKASSASLIDIHLVEIAEIDDGSTLESSSNVAAESITVESTQVDSDQAGTEQLISDVADTINSNEQLPSPDIDPVNKAANVHAFKQILVSKQPKKNKPQYVENFTPQDLTRKGALKTTTAKVGAKPVEQDGAAEKTKFDEHYSADASEAEAKVVVITAPDLAEITEKRQAHKNPDQASSDNNATSIGADDEVNAEVQTDTDIVEQARADAANKAAAERQAEEAKQAEAARLAEEVRQAEAARLAEEARQAEAARLAEEARQAEAARLAEEARQAEATRLAEEAEQAEAARLSEEAKQAEAARKAEEAEQAEAARLAEEARQAEAARLAEAAKQAEAARLAEEAKQAEAVRLAEVAKQAEAAALAKATTQAEGFVQAELDAIKVEVELAEAFAKLDLTLDDESIVEAFLTGEFVADSETGEPVSNVNPVSSIEKESVQAESDASDSLALAETIIEPIPADHDTNAEQLAPAMASMLRTEHTAQEDKAAQKDEAGAIGSHALTVANGGLADDSENLNVTESDLVPVTGASEFVTMAELYDSPEVDLDDTTSNGFGGLPKTNFSQPQGRFYRLWLSVRKTTRNIVDSSIDWLKRIRNK